MTGADRRWNEWIGAERSGLARWPENPASGWLRITLASNGIACAKVNRAWDLSRLDQGDALIALFARVKNLFT